MGDFGSAVSSGMGDIGSSMGDAMNSLAGAFGGSNGMGSMGNAISNMFGGGSSGGATAANFTPSAQPFSDPNTAQAVSMSPPTSTTNQDPTGTAGGTQSGTTPNQPNQPQNQDDQATRLANLRKQLMASVKQMQQGRNPYQTGGGAGANQGGAQASGGGAPQPGQPAGQAPSTQGPQEEPPIDLPNPLDAAGQIDTSGVPRGGPLGLRPGASATGVDTGPGRYDANPSGRNAAGPWGYGGGQTATEQPPIEGLPPPGDLSTLEPPWMPAKPIGPGSVTGIGGPLLSGMAQAMQPSPANTGELQPGQPGFVPPGTAGGFTTNLDPSETPYDGDPAAQPQPARPVTPTPGPRPPALGGGPGNEEEAPTGRESDPARRTPETKSEYEDWLKRQGVKPSDAKKKADDSNLPTKKGDAPAGTAPAAAGGRPPPGGYGPGGMNAGNLFRDILGLSTGGGGMMLPMLAMMAMGGMGGMFGGGRGRHGGFMRGGGFHPGGVGGRRGGMMGGAGGRGYGRMPGFGGGHLPPGHYPMRGGGFGYHPGGFHEGWDAHENWPGGGGGGGFNPLGSLESALGYGGNQGGFDQNGQPTPGGQYNRQGQFVGGGRRGQGGGGGGFRGSGANTGPPQQGPWSSNPFLATLVGAESGGRQGPNVRGDGGLAKGYFQFHDATWRQAAQNVPGASQYASAEDAPPDVQQAVAETMPINQWGSRTRQILHAQFGDFDERMTIGDLARQFGGNTGGSTTAAAPATASAAPPPANVGPASQVFPSWTPS